jgi:solute carrier family 50 (sugar transporter)
MRARKQLGKVNPMPYPSLTANSLGWLTYGLLVRDYYVFAPNVTGVCMGLYFTMSCYLYADESVRTRMDLQLNGMCALVFVACMVSFITFRDNLEHGKLLLGLVSVLLLVSFYTSPLSEFAAIIRRRDASSISLPLAAATLVNAGLWLVYGLVLADVFVYAPNVLGILCALAQFVLRWRYPGDGAAEVLPIKQSVHPLPLPHSDQGMGDGKGTTTDIHAPVLRSASGAAYVPVNME